MITEDKVRDKARNILGLNESLKGAKADVGQLTTFNQLGFPGISDKPDGWYLPDNRNEVALILEILAQGVEDRETREGGRNDRADDSTMRIDRNAVRESLLND